jgi:hypothetical protein
MEMGTSIGLVKGKTCRKTLFFLIALLYRKKIYPTIKNWVGLPHNPHMVGWEN